MPTLTANLPHFPALVRAEFLYGLADRGVGDFVRGTVHAVSALANRALGFHVLLHNGAHVGRLPIHAIVTSKAAPRVDVDRPWLLQLWDCMSYQLAVTELDYLAECRVRAALADRSQHGGTYLCTIDYYGSTLAEAAGDAGWKCHHLIELDDGRLAALPNNRLCFYEASTVKPFPPDAPPRYVTMPRTWKVEDGEKWRPEDSDRMFYDVDQPDAGDAGGAPTIPQATTHPSPLPDTALAGNRSPQRFMQLMAKHLDEARRQLHHPRTTPGADA